MFLATFVSLSATIHINDISYACIERVLMYLVYLRKIDLFLATDGFSDRSFAETTVDTAKVNNAIFHEN